MANDYDGLGGIYYTRGDLDQAEELYRKALEIDEEIGCREGMAKRYGTLGEISQMRGDLDRAESDYGTAATLIPDDPMIGFNRGLIAARRGDKDNARRLCREAYHHAPPVLQEHIRAVLGSNPAYTSLSESLAL